MRGEWSDGMNGLTSNVCQLPIVAGWWYTYSSEKYESQLGWWNSQYMEKKKHVPNQQPGWVISHQNDSELHGFLPLVTLVVGKITMYLIIFRNRKFLGSRATLSCNLRLEPGLYPKIAYPKNPMPHFWTTMDKPWPTHVQNGTLL